MLKLNLQRLLLMIGAITLLVASVGCGNSDGNILSSDKNVQDSKEKPKLETGVGELSASFRTDGNEGVTFSAEPYIQAPELSWEYSLDIEIKADKIYINGVLYEKSSSTPPTVLYSDGFLSYAAYTDEISDAEITNILTKIKDCGSCYLLKAEQESKAGQMIYVYEIDNFLYFVRFFDNGEVMRIHRAPVAQEVKR